MNEYWHAISSKHQDKVRNLAKTYGITIDRAFRNIVRHMEWEMEQVTQGGEFRGFLTGQRIEGMIDLINR